MVAATAREPMRPSRYSCSDADPPTPGALVSPTPASVRLARLFRDAGAAHHAAYAATNGDDPDWPDWYAAWLAAPMAELLGSALPTAALAAELRAVDAEHHRAPPGTAWPEYYAEWFLRRYPSAPAGWAAPVRAPRA